MAGRFLQQNENKELRAKVRRNRAGAQGMGAARTFIVAGSLVAAMGGWAAFSYQDAQVASASTGSTGQPAVSVDLSAVGNAVSSVGSAIASVFDSSSSLYSAGSGQGIFPITSTRSSR